MTQFELIERTRVDVRQESGGLQDHLRRVGDVVHGRSVATRGEPARGLVVAQFRSLAQSEQGFAHTGVATRLGHLHDILEAHEGRRGARGGLGESAVTTSVAAQVREGNEHLGRVRHHVTVRRSRPIESDDG